MRLSKSSQVDFPLTATVPNLKKKYNFFVASKIGVDIDLLTLLFFSGHWLQAQGAQKQLNVYPHPYLLGLLSRRDQD